MEKLSGEFTFMNKENSIAFNKIPPKTPKHSASIIFKDHNNSKKINVLSDAFKTPKNPHDRNTKRIPLGGKDKNALHLMAKPQADEHQKGLLSNSASKRRARRLRTPLTIKTNRKLNILKDDGVEDIDIDSKSYQYEDEDIETVPDRENPIPFTPLNYEPFTEKELDALRNSPTMITKNAYYSTDDSDTESFKEFPVSFDFDDEDDRPKEDQKPNFMKPTVASNVKGAKFDVYNDGLSTTDMIRLIEE